MIDLGVVSATWTDLLRLVAVPVLAWAAFRDVKTRRVPNETWLPLAGIAVLTLLWDGYVAWTTGGFAWEQFAIPALVSIGFVVPIAYGFWLLGGFGGADAKALMVLAVLFPTFPTYIVASGPAFPLQATTTQAFAFTILTNTVLLGIVYPLGVAARNAIDGEFGKAMFVARRIHWSAIEETHGRLMETEAGLSRSGADLDALRMYLRWRGSSLSEVRDRPEVLRDPESLPDSPNPPTDGAVGIGDGESGPVPDGGRPDRGAADGSDAEPTDGPDANGADDDAIETVDADGIETYDDPWGADAFCDDVETTYGTSPEELRGALETLATADSVWVSPGIPFIVPMFLGLVAALTYGDLLFGLLGALGLAP